MRLPERPQHAGLGGAASRDFTPRKTTKRTTTPSRAKRIVGDTCGPYHGPRPEPAQVARDALSARW